MHAWLHIFSQSACSIARDNQYDSHSVNQNKRKIFGFLTFCIFVWGKVIFSQMFVCPQGGQRPPGQRPPRQKPRGQRPLDWPPRTNTSPGQRTPGQSPHRQRPPWTGTPWTEIPMYSKQQAVRILLECILVITI